MTPKGPPPVIKPKPKSLAPPVGKKPDIAINSTANEDDQYIASLRGNLKKAGTNSTPKVVNQAVVNSLVSQPISLTLDPDALESEPETEEPPAVQSRLRAPPASEYKPKLAPPNANTNLNPAVMTSASYNPVTTSPFRSSVNKLSFPPPPQRNVAVSPLKKKSVEPSSDSLSASPPPILPSRLEKTVSRETIEYAEGMRSPLKKNVSSASVTASFPPPPKRNVGRPAVAAVTHSDDEDEEDIKPPSLPVRKQSGRIQTPAEPSDDDEEETENAPPKLPSRNRESSRATKNHYSDEEDGDRRPPRPRHREQPPRRRDSHERRRGGYDYEDDDDEDDDNAYERLRSPSGRKTSANDEGRHHHHHHHHREERERESRNGGYDSLDDEYDNYGRKKSSRRNGDGESSSTSQFLSNAKSFSKGSYYMAREKSGPFAKQAMGGLNKMKNKIKNSMKDDQNYSYSDDSDDDRFKRRTAARNEDEGYGNGRSARRAPERRERREKPSRDEEDEDSEDEGRYDGPSSSKRSERSTPETPRRPERGERVLSRNTPEPPKKPERNERVSSRTTPEPPRKPSRPTPVSRYESEEEESESEDDADESCEIVDESIDEDRPSLPSRNPLAARTQAVGIPLPGLTDDIKLKPVVKVKPKPPVPAKEKPILPPKKTKLLNEVKPEIIQPPPSRRLASNNSTTSASNPPPAPPSRNRAPVAPPSRNAASAVAAWKEPKINFDFQSQWFLSNDTSKLPKELQGLNFQCSHGSVGSKEFKIYAFRLHDLATLKLKLVWKKDSSVPYDSLTDEVDFIPPPVASKALLTSGNQKYGEHVANWSEVKEGQTVGDGECWTLAHDALEKGCGKHAFVSSGLTHGALVATFRGKNSGVPDIVVPAVSDEIRRGDILQFKSCVFNYPQRTMMFGSPDHTAVILDVKPSDDSNKDSRLKWFEIIHQNIGGVKKVRVGDIDVGKLTEGEIRVFRPVDSEWIADLAEVVI